MTGRQLRRGICVLLGIAVFCCACGMSQFDTAQEETEHLPYVGIVLKSTDNPYFSLIKAGAEYEADLLGVQVMVVSPDTEENVQEQAELVDTLADMAVDVIVISPSSEEDLTDALSKAEENGKLLMSVDTATDIGSCYIGSDQYLSAYRQGAYAAGLTESGGAVILRGSEKDKTHNLRTYGLEDGLQDNGVSVLAVQDCACNEDTAEQVMETLLEQYLDMTVVCTTADSMAIGALRAIESAEREDIHIVTFDGMTEALELVRDGKLDAAFAQDPYEMGKLCIEYACKLYNGESVETSIHTDVTLITAESAEERIEYLKEELNVWVSG